MASLEVTDNDFSMLRLSRISGDCLASGTAGEPVNIPKARYLVGQS
jgi:hypothetical protein